MRNQESSVRDRITEFLYGKKMVAAVMFILCLRLFCNKRIYCPVITRIYAYGCNRRYDPYIRSKAGK